MDDKQQKIYTALLIELRRLGTGLFDVYDGALPPEGTAYPFVYLGENQELDGLLKGAISARVEQTIHVYTNNLRARGTFSAVMARCKQACYNITKEDSSVMLSSISAQVLPDTTTAVPLLHGVIDASFR
jgi:hypothetical protein